MADRKKESAKTGEGNNPEPVTGEVAKVTFPVIGIGASAGGLEALSELFAKMPIDTGAAFVIVQHLAPTRESAMPELLARYTRLPMHEVTDNLKIEPDSVYLIPPGKNLAVVDGKLQLLDEAAAPGIRHPIDFFFKSLAAERGIGAVGIILSGTGTDGTAGARAIKGETGLVIAQDPAEAKYDGMPRSVIDAGLADYVLKVSDIPEKVSEYIRRIPEVVAVPRETSDDLAKSLPKIIALIRNETGNDFSNYKENTLLRRIVRRMAIHQIIEPTRYIRFLQQNPAEITTLFKELLINVTAFFRDREAFEALKKNLKENLSGKPASEEIRAWVVGCSTGEEAYSIAIIIRELLDELKKNNRVQVFGTDLDGDAIDIARAGVYRGNIADDITPERLQRFFTKKNDFYQVNTGIRETLVFAAHNLIKEPPFLRMDLVSARNLLIYLKGDLQKRIIPIFHYALRGSGLLFLSPSETVGEYTDLFESIDWKWKIYRYKGVSQPRVNVPPFPLQVSSPIEEPVARRRGGEIKPPDVLQATDRLLLSEYAPPYVVIDSANTIIFVRGDTGKFLKLAEGKATMDVLELARRGLKSHLALAIRTARLEKAEASREGVRIEAAGNPVVDILVRPAPAPGPSADYLMVIFKECLSPGGGTVAETVRKGRKAGRPETQTDKDRQLLDMEQELKRSREDLRATIEEMESSNEELKSANEELLSSNEELQSTNEELETSREELRAVNEELNTLNAENQEQIRQLNRSRGDMHNLLNTINIATVFLDTDLNIRSFTPAATGLFSLRESDVGRPIGEISSSLDYDNMVIDARRVLDTLVKEEKEVRTRDGRWYSLRIIPYRSQENEITGVVLTFFDVNERRLLETALHYTQSIVDTLWEPMLVLDKEFRVVSANRAFSQVFRVTEEETKGKYIYDLGNRQWDIPELRRLLEEIIPKNSYFNNYPVEHDFPLLGKHRMLLNARRLYEELGSQRILLAFEDVTGQLNVEKLFTGKRPGEDKKSGK